MSCTQVSDYIQNERSQLATENGTLTTLQSTSPLDKITQSIHSALSSLGAASLSQSPLAGLGTDFLAQQIQKNGTQIINNATGIIQQEVAKVAGVNLSATLQQAQTLIFNTISACLTANNDLSLIFLQNLAKNIVSALAAKKAILQTLVNDVQALNNALLTMTAAKPFFSQYLTNLRLALTQLVSANNNFQTVTNTYIARNLFLTVLFNTTKQQLVTAQGLMQPPAQPPAQNQQSALLIKGGQLLNQVGIPTQPQQLTALIAVPQLAQQVTFDSAGYFLATVKANALIAAFLVGYSTFTKSASSLLDQHSISMLQSLSQKLGDLIGRMATSLNGSATATVPNLYAQSPITGVVTAVTANYIAVAAGTNTQQVPLQVPSIPRVAVGDHVAINQSMATYNPDPIGVSTKSLAWVIELQSIITYAGTVPGSTLASVQTSNDALTTYLAAVKKIQSENNRTANGATLIATQGQEDLTDLESQLITLCLQSVRAIVTPSVAQGVVALARTVIARLNLSIIQDAEITNALQSFINAQVSLTSTLPNIASTIFTTLKNAGMDRASDLLNSGSFTDFFNMNSKTCTYAGAALVGIAALKQCLTTTTDRANLSNAQQTIMRDQASKALLAQRTATSGFAQQKVQNQKTDAMLATIQSNAQTACNKCGLNSPGFNPLGIISTVGGAMGISSLGNTTLPSSLANVGKGFL